MEKFELPPWIEAELWDAYLEMRKLIKKPMTEYSKHLAVRKLEQLRRLGNPANAVLEAAILNSWQGLWPLKESREELARSEARIGHIDFGEVHVRSEAQERIHARNSKELAEDLKRVGQRKVF